MMRLTLGRRHCLRCLGLELVMKESFPVMFLIVCSLLGLCFAVCCFQRNEIRSSLVFAAPVTRLELHPNRLEIPLGGDREVHIEPFSRDTPLMPVDALFFVEHPQTVEIRKFDSPMVTLRGLELGQTYFRVSVSGLDGKVFIQVVEK